MRGYENLEILCADSLAFSLVGRFGNNANVLLFVIRVVSARIISGEMDQRLKYEPRNRRRG